MALYSWFSRTDKKPNIKTEKVENDIIKASKTVKYIENFTMWPTATIKSNVEITSFNDITPSNHSDKSLKPKKAILPNITALTVIKAN